MEEERVSGWEHGVPKEEIIPHLYLSDCIRFRLTCKSGESITLTVPRPFPSNEFWFQNPSFPWFISFTKKNQGSSAKIFHPVYNDKYYMTMPEQIAGAHIRHSKYGWLLMTKGPSSVFFFNPLTRAIITLPDVTFPGYPLVCVTFSAPPTSSDCIVFGHDESHAKFVAILFCRRGQSSWTELHIDDERGHSIPWVPFMASYCNPIFLDGVFYCLDDQGKLGIFNAEESDKYLAWKVLPVTLPEHNMSLTVTNFIAEFKGDLLSVFVGSMGNPVYVYKLHWSEMKWMKLRDLGHRSLFLSRTTSLLLPATAKGTENRIYFPRFWKDGNSLLPPFQEKDMVFYSLRTGRYHSFGSNSNSNSRQDWFDTLAHEYCSTWFEPHVDNTTCDEQLQWFSGEDLGEEDEE